VLLGFVATATAFLVIVILPRIRRIYSDVKLELPEATKTMIDAFDWCVDNPLTVFAAIAGVVALVIIPLVSTTVRWFMPVVGRFYRAEMQGITLRGLSALLASERTAPRALNLLAGNDNLPWIVRRKLDRAAAGAARGEPLAESLHAVGLLPGSMAPLVATSERVRTLPAALAELGDLLAVRAIGTETVVDARARRAGRGGRRRGGSLSRDFRPAHPPHRTRDLLMARRRHGFTVLETCIALALLLLAGTLVAELAVFSLRERARADVRLAAIEWAANVLEAAQALPAPELTPAWAADRQLPADLRDRLGGGNATVEVGSEKGIVGVRRVTVTVRWAVSAEKVEAPVILTALFRAEGAP
jgi:hypothetical protein